MDEQPRFHLEALRWFASLTEVAQVAASDLTVHTVGRQSSDVLDYLGRQGVNLRCVEPFDRRSPHCNKISGALSLAESGIRGTVVLCDADVVVLDDPRQLDLPEDAIAGKPVDEPNPPLEIILDIFAASGIPPPETVPLAWSDGLTVSGNNNGGLYLIPGPLLGRVASAWAHWAAWLLDRIELCGAWSVHIDQVAMALGLAAEEIGSVPLDVRWNTPVHDRGRIRPDAPEPSVIHYHQALDRYGLLLTTGIPSLDGRIEEVNAAILKVWQRTLPENDQGSAPASKTDLTDDEQGHRRTVVATIVASLEPRSVLQVGCGGMGILGDADIREYRYIDPSPGAVQRAREERTDGEFLVGTIADHPGRADLVICVDPSIGPPGLTLDALTELLWDRTGRALVISGSGLDGSLKEVLERVAPDAELYPVAHQRWPTAFVALRSPTERHPRDFAAATLAPLADRHPDLLTLMTLRLHARWTTRFYPDHAPRLWEYPVVARLIAATLPPGSRLVDVGAGVTPLAPFLTSLGYVVDTVDPSPAQRTWPPQPDWNEWDFLDYASAGLAHRSWNCTLGELPPASEFDGIYSVSVIEHVPAVVRRALLTDIAARVRPGGLVVLTIDLARGSNSLWNRNRGLEVEDPSVHGTFEDIIAEGAAVGLGLVQRETVRDWGDTEVDIGLVAMRQTRDAKAIHRHNPGSGILSRLRRLVI